MRVFHQSDKPLRAIRDSIPAALQRVAFAILIGGIFAIAIAQIMSAKIEARDQTQTAPFFSMRDSPSQTRGPIAARYLE